MNITKLEQSGFILTTESGFTLAVDIGAYTPVENLTGKTVDAFLVSHLHGDHLSVPHIKAVSPKTLYVNKECIDVIGEETLSAEIKQIAVGDVIDIGPIRVTCFNVDHGPNVKVRPVENFGFLIDVDEKKMYFAGDMFYPSGIDVTKLEVDIALIPVGTHYTFGPQEALDFVKTFKNVGKVIPMHYENNPETREQFITLAMI